MTDGLDIDAQIRDRLEGLRRTLNDPGLSDAMKAEEDVRVAGVEPTLGRIDRGWSRRGRWLTRSTWKVVADLAAAPGGLTSLPRPPSSPSTATIPTWPGTATAPRTSSKRTTRDLGRGTARALSRARVPRLPATDVAGGCRRRSPLSPSRRRSAPASSSTASRHPRSDEHGDAARRRLRRHPGHRQADALYKPGSEKLSVLFQLDVQLANEKRWGPGDHLTVESHATVFHAPTGARLGYGEGIAARRGSASTPTASRSAPARTAASRRSSRARPSTAAAGCAGRSAAAAARSGRTATPRSRARRSGRSTTRTCRTCGTRS
jgi:hypothetical protein